MAIKPLGKNIIFIFKDKVNSKGEFELPPTASGIQLVGGHENSARQSRWGVAVAVGPNVKDVKPGQEILLPALRWTNGITVAEQKFWKTDETEVVAVRNKPESDIAVLGQFIVFNPTPRKAIKSTLIIVPTGDHEAPAEGVVFGTGPKASDEVVTDVTIYYSDVNFESFLVHQGKRYGFIKDEEVFAFSTND